MGWDDKFSAPIGVPGRAALVTLLDAATYITELPKEQQDQLAWQSAIHVLIEAADNRGPIDFARLGMMQALQPKGEPVYRSVSNDPVWRNNREMARNR